MPTIYEELTAAGIECSNWQSDLYFPVTPQTREILKRHPNQTRSTFVSNIDGRAMYECPFAFDPFWTARKPVTVKE